MSRKKKSMSMAAAECARRAGLTVRALRVYERQRLIEPRRTGKGWRCYGPKELRRLNVIVTLKAFGMTLAQIRTLLATNPPASRTRASTAAANLQCEKRGGGQGSWVGQHCTGDDQNRKAAIPG